MQWLWVIVIGAAIGAFAGAIISNDKSAGWIVNVITGMAGAAAKYFSARGARSWQGLRQFRP